MRALARATLAFLALGAAVPGALALFAPRTFYDDFPGFTSWVSLLPPYNEHLVTDVGGFYLGFAVLFAWAAWTLAPALVRPLCLGWAVAATGHFVYHATHLDPFPTADAIGQMLSLGSVLALAVVPPLALHRAQAGAPTRR